MSDHNNDFERRDFLKLGILLAGGLCPFVRGPLFSAEDKANATEYKILKGNRCPRCLKVIDDMLADKEIRKELDEIFPDDKTIYMIYGRRVKIPDKDATIAIGRCARTVKTPVTVVKGCPPSKEKIMSAIREAYAKAKKSKKYRRKYKGLFG